MIFISICWGRNRDTCLMNSLSRLELLILRPGVIRSFLEPPGKVICSISRQAYHPEAEPPTRYCQLVCTSRSCRSPSWTLKKARRSLRSTTVSICCRWWCRIRNIRSNGDRSPSPARLPSASARCTRRCWRTASLWQLYLACSPGINADSARSASRRACCYIHRHAFVQTHSSDARTCCRALERWCRTWQYRSDRIPIWRGRPWVAETTWWERTVEDQTSCYRSAAGCRCICRDTEFLVIVGHPHHRLGNLLSRSLQLKQSCNLIT